MIVVVLLALILFAILFPGVLRFLFLVALAIVAWFTLVEVGRAQTRNLDMPDIDVEAVCSSQLSQFAGNPNTKNLMNTCIEREQGFYNGLKEIWPLASDKLKSDCLHIVRDPGGMGSKKYEIYSLCMLPRFEREQEASAPPAHFQR